MGTSHLLHVRFFSNCPQVCGAKLFQLVNGQALSGASSRVTAALARNLSSSLAHANAAWMTQSSLRVLAPTQNKLVWLASSSSSAITEDDDLAQLSQNTKKNYTIVRLSQERRDNESLMCQVFVSKGDTEWTDDDWLHLVESLPLASRGSWEVICMHMLYVNKNMPGARQLMRYLETQPTPPSLIALTYYIGLLGETSSGCEQQSDETYKYYKLLRSRSDVLDAASIEVLISGLSMTRNYLECVKLVRMCQETSQPSPTSLVKLLRAGLRNGDTDICKWSLTELEDMTDPSSLTGFMPQVIEECLASNQQLGLEMVMGFMEKHGVLLQRDALDDITQIFIRYQPNQWTAEYGHINHKNGQCVVCGHGMKRNKISDSDFQAIRSVFLEQVIVGRNVFFKTSPNEVDSFVKFVQRMGPFDVVMDGLNILFRKVHSPSLKQVSAQPVDCRIWPHQSQNLENAVKYFCSQGKKILILGNKIILKQMANMKKVKPTPAVYITSTTRSDDAFFLYAALHSGKDTLVISGDKLRDHKFLLEPRLRPIFQQWISAAQVYGWYVTSSDEFRIGRRKLYNLGPAQDDNGWHIPQMDFSAADPFGRFTVLCLRNRNRETVVSDSGDRHVKPGRETVVSDSGDRHVKPGRETVVSDSGDRHVKPGRETVVSDSGDRHVKPGRETVVSDSGDRHVKPGRETVVSDSGDRHVKPGRETVVSDSGDRHFVKPGRETVVSDSVDRHFVKPGRETVVSDSVDRHFVKPGTETVVSDSGDRHFVKPGRETVVSDSGDRHFVKPGRETVVSDSGDRHFVKPGRETVVSDSGDRHFVKPGRETVVSDSVDRHFVKPGRETVVSDSVDRHFVKPGRETVMSDSVDRHFVKPGRKTRAVSVGWDASQTRPSEKHADMGRVSRDTAGIPGMPRANYKKGQQPTNNKSEKEWFDS